MKALTLERIATLTKISLLVLQQFNKHFSGLPRVMLSQFLFIGKNLNKSG